MCKPPPLPEDFRELGIMTHCTCDEYDWPEEVCPFDEDVHNDPTSMCKCCPYHRGECRWDI